MIKLHLTLSEVQTLRDSVLQAGLETRSNQAEAEASGGMSGDFKAYADRQFKVLDILDLCLAAGG